MKFSTISANTFLILLVSIASIATASGQAPTWNPHATRPLEKYDNPPAYIYRLDTSPRLISPHGVFISYQVNVDAMGNNIVGDAANECSISVDPTDGNKMAIGWRQFDSVLSNFRQGGWGYTTDAGVHWTFPGVLEPGVFRSDPVTNSNETGTFFYLSLLQTFCENMYRSTNGGQSWLELQADGLAGGGDKQWFTIDKTNGPGHGFQYQSSDGADCDNTGVVEFQRSTDGGVTWQAPIHIPNDPTIGTLDVDTNGNLFIGGEGFNTFYCVRSSNAQFGGQTPTFDQVTPVNMGGDLVFGGSINPGGLAGQAFLAVDRSGGPTNNNIYMLASVLPPGQSTTEVMFVRSTDGGANLQRAHRINDDTSYHSKWHWFGTFSVAPNGRLDAVWYDTRNAANNTDSQLFYSFSTDAGVTWSTNVAVSTHLILSRAIRTRTRSATTLPLFPTRRAATWLTRPPSTSTRTRSARGRRLLCSGISCRRTYPDTNTDGVPDCNSNANAETYSHSTVDSHAKGASYAASSAVRRAAASEQ